MLPALRSVIHSQLFSCSDFHPRMVSLTGTPTQVGEIAKKFRVYFSHVDHTDESDDDYMGMCLCEQPCGD